MSRVGIFILILISLFFNATQSFADDESICAKHLRKEDPDRKARKEALSAIAPFENYFKEIKKRLLERDELVDISMLALLAEEHILLMGPPGNAKSMLADIILGNIKGEDGKTSYFRLQMTPETTLSETHGPLDFKTLNETGRYVRILEEGMLLSRNVFIDEIFDARPNALRNILGMLNERAHAQGVHIQKGNIETAFAASNRYISEVYQKAGDDGPKAVLDRFAFSAFITGDFEDTQSYIQLIKGAKKDVGPLPSLTFEEVEKLRRLVRQVEVPDTVAMFLAILSTKMKAESEALEQSSLKNYNDKLRAGEEPGIPYRSTKYYSPRTLGKASGVLKAIVVSDWIRKKGKRSLEVNLDDIKTMYKFFTLNGPSDAYINQAIERTTNPHERTQLMSILQEREMFEKYYNELLNESNQVFLHFSLHDIQTEVQLAQSDSEKEELVKKIIAFVVALDDESELSKLHHEKSGKEIGIGLIREQYKEMLSFLLGSKKQAIDYLENLDKERARIIAEKKKQEELERAREEEARKAEERRIAAAKAAEEAIIREAKAQQEKIVETLSAKKATFASKAMINNFNDVVTTYSKDLNLYAVIDPSTSLLKIIDLNRNHEKGADSYSVTDKMIDLTQDLGGHNITEMYFVDKEHLLFFSDLKTNGVILNINTLKKEEIILHPTGSNVYATFHSKTGNVFVADVREDVLIKTNVSSNRREKVHFKFANADMEQKFKDSIFGRGGAFDFSVSEDGNYLTMLSIYGSYQFVFDLRSNEFVQYKEVLSREQQLHRLSKLIHNGNEALILNKDASPGLFTVYQGVQNHLQTGFSYLPHVEMAVGAAAGRLYLVNLKNINESLQIQINNISERSGSSFKDPLVLPDGRIVVIYGSNGSASVYILE